MLYFEVVHTGAVFPPLLRDQQNAHEAIDRVRRRMRNSGSSLLLNVRDLPKGVSGRDLLWVSYGSCVDQVFAVGKAYDQLQKEGVIRTWSYCKREETDHYEFMKKDMAGMLKAFVRSLDQFIQNDDIFQIENESDSYAYVIPELIESLDDVVPEMLDSTDPTVVRACLAIPALVDFVANCEACSGIGRPIVYGPMQRKMLERLSKAGALSKVSSNTLPDKARLAHGLTATVLRKIPLVMPKSTDALLEIRQALSDELHEFRAALDDIAADLAHAKKGDVTNYDIEYEVDVRIQRPLRRLERRLEKPGLEIGKNLLSTGSFISQAVSFGIATMTNLGAIGTPLLTLGAGLLAAAFQTKTKRAEAIRDSGLSFIIGAKTRNA